MSQKPAPQRPVQPRVPTGVPWWLWLILVIVGGGVGFSVVTNLVPDDPEKLYQDALAAAEAKNSELFHRNREKLKQFPDYARQQKLLEGISLLGGARPLLAVPPLTEAAGEAGDSNKQIRSLALKYLGTAYAVADDRKTALQIFETMLKEDEDSSAARLNIASILMDLIAWEEALEHLNVLIEKKQNLAQVLNMRGEIRFELQQYQEAAEDFEGSIAADSSDPTNSMKTNRMLDCYTRLQDYEKAAGIADRADPTTSRSTARSELLLEKGDLNGALAGMEAIRSESPNAPEPSLTYGRVMLKYNTKEKAEEGLVTIRNAVLYTTRDVELYRVMAELALMAGETELAGLAQQNVDLLDAMNKEFEQKLAEVVKTRDDAEPRMQLAELAKNLGKRELAFRIYDGLSRYYPEMEPELLPMKMALLDILPQLVSTAVGSGPEPPRNPPASDDADKPEEAK